MGLAPAAGWTVMLALLYRVGSATLVAVTVTAWAVETPEGAVYSPVLLIVPIRGLMLHVTAVLAVFTTVAVNCCVCPAMTVALAGLAATVTTPACGMISMALTAALETCGVSWIRSAPFVTVTLNWRSTAA